ncbi:MAG: glycine C-acetyltransferase [Gemmatimonadetes bacterium]|nr:glycine C-acetyltransferase [Gemmatimonadota bacterium]
MVAAGEGSQVQAGGPRAPATDLIESLRAELAALAEARTLKHEVPLAGPQGARVGIAGRAEPVIMLTSNNYLGLAADPRVVEAAIDGLRRFGNGMASVRFICGTQTLHRELETTIAAFFETDDAILYTSCWNANEALFATVLGEGDAVFSDELNHASIIDGIRLCKASRYRYRHNDVADLERQLAEDRSRHRIVITDGVFSMEGEIAPLVELRDLCRREGALLAVDDSHATGVLGRRGRGTAEELGIHGEVDIVTGTLGKALGGAAGGFITGPQPLVDVLRQRSRPYLFSNSLPPPITASALRAFQIVDEDPALLARLRNNTDYLRGRLAELGFEVRPGVHPVIPLIVGETALAIQMSRELLDEGVYVSGFGYPVVPQGDARLRVQVSAALSRDDLDSALEAFGRVGRRHGLVA